MREIEEFSSEYLLRLAAVKEFEAALKYKKTYEELTSGMLGLFTELLDYCKKNRIEIPDAPTYYRIASHVQSMILSRVSPSRNTDSNHPDTEQNPKKPS